MIQNNHKKIRIYIDPKTVVKNSHSHGYNMAYEYVSSLG